MGNRRTRVSKSIVTGISVADLNKVVEDKLVAEEAAEEVTTELPELMPELVGHPGVVEGVTHASPERTAPELAAEAPLTMAQLDARDAAAAAPKPVAGPVLHVKQGLALRGGRGEWYKLLCKYDGKPVAEYIADGKANPASHYTARSTKCGQPKTPESRLSWFKRAGIVTIS